MDTNAIKHYLETHARPLDRAMYQYIFEGGDTEAVLKELAMYQNEDGGFGNGIEPDIRLPQSTPIATWMAFQTINELDVDPNHPLIVRALDYFLNTYDDEWKGWRVVVPEVDEHPHAPWWDYKSAMEHFGWGNPSAEVLGFFLRYRPTETALIDTLQKRALERVSQVEASDFHEVFTFKALFEFADGVLKETLHKPVRALVKQAASTDPESWKAYSAPPLKFINNPDDPFIDLFDKDLIQQNLDFIEQTMVDGSHWEPNWDWAGKYPEAWEQAKLDWSGHLTVKNLQILHLFGGV